jgi:hypothetical protein
VKFSAIVAQHDECRDRDAKHVEHNHGDLSREKQVYFKCTEKRYQNETCELPKAYAEAESPLQVVHRPALLREISVEIQIVGSQSHALARKQEEGLRRYLFATRIIHFRYSSRYINIMLRANEKHYFDVNRNYDDNGRNTRVFNQLNSVPPDA